MLNRYLSAQIFNRCFSTQDACGILLRIGAKQLCSSLTSSSYAKHMTAICYVKNSACFERLLLSPASNFLLKIGAYPPLRSLHTSSILFKTGAKPMLKCQTRWFSGIIVSEFAIYGVFKTIILNIQSIPCVLPSVSRFPLKIGAQHFCKT